MFYHCTEGYSWIIFFCQALFSVCGINSHRSGYRSPIFTIGVRLKNSYPLLSRNWHRALSFLFFLSSSSSISIFFLLLSIAFLLFLSSNQRKSSSISSIQLKSCFSISVLILSFLISSSLLSFFSFFPKSPRKNLKAFIVNKTE